MLPAKPARRYAGALYGVAGGSNNLDAVRADMEALRGLVDDSPELAGFLGNHELPRRCRTAILTELFRDRVHEITWQFLLLLDEKRRLAILRDICLSFHDVYCRENGISRALLACAFAPDADELRFLGEHIRRLAGGPVELEAIVRPALLGGFSARIEDTVYDLSLAGALRKVKERMIRG